jgi:hypothetical protein
MSKYWRSLQLSKEAIQHFKTWTFTNFFLLLWVIFALLDPDPDSESGSGSTDPIESGSGSATLLVSVLSCSLYSRHSGNGFARMVFAWALAILWNWLTEKCSTTWPRIVLFGSVVLGHSSVVDPVIFLFFYLGGQLFTTFLATEKLVGK